MASTHQGTKILVATIGASAAPLSSTQLLVKSCFIEPHQDNASAEGWIGDEDLTAANKNGAYCNANAPIRLEARNNRWIDLNLVYLAGTQNDKFTVSYLTEI